MGQEKGGWGNRWRGWDRRRVDGAIGGGVGQLGEWWDEQYMERVGQEKGGTGKGWEGQ